MNDAQTLALESGNAARIADYASLAKPRITLMVLATVALGYAAAQGAADGLVLLHVIVGAAFASAGANALNLVLDLRADARMRRTAARPVAAGRISPSDGLTFGTLLCVTGMAYLTLLVHPVCGALAAATIGSYLFLYTPLKSRTSLCTVVGAVPGAIPPMIGWAARTGGLEAGAWILFSVMFFWQLPHFLAIAWLYRDDYARAGYPMLPVNDPDAVATGRQMVLQSLALLLASVVPFLYGMAGPVYLSAALALGFGTVLLGLRFALAPGRTGARLLFVASILYLPVVLGLLAYGG